MGDDLRDHVQHLIDGAIRPCILDREKLDAFPLHDEDGGRCHLAAAGASHGIRALTAGAEAEGNIHKGHDGRIAQIDGLSHHGLGGDHLLEIFKDLLSNFIIHGSFPLF